VVDQSEQSRLSERTLERLNPLSNCGTVSKEVMHIMYIMINVLSLDICRPPKQN